MTKVELENRTRISMELSNPCWVTKIYNPQGNQILKKSICCLILENNRENKLIPSLWLKERIKKTRGKEKIAYRQTILHHLNCQQDQHSLSCQAQKKIFHRDFFTCTYNCKSYITSRRTHPYKANLIFFWHSNNLF